MKYEVFLGIYFPRQLASLRYKSLYGKDIDWDHPKSIDEKNNWLKFNIDTSLWSELADKYHVRQYVKNCGLEDTDVNHLFCSVHKIVVHKLVYLYQLYKKVLNIFVLL